MSNNMCVIGTVGTEPRLTYSQGQVAFCTFRLASTDRRYDNASGQWVNGETNWYSVQAFRGLAEHAKRSFAKGDRVIISGRLRVRKWSTDDNHGTNVEVDADALGHDLRWGTSRFTPDAPGGGAVPDAGQPDNGTTARWGANTSSSEHGQESARAPEPASANAMPPRDSSSSSASEAVSASAAESTALAAPAGDGFVPVAV